jgi:hypothetical protein
MTYKDPSKGAWYAHTHTQPGVYASPTKPLARGLGSRIQERPTDTRHTQTYIETSGRRMQGTCGCPVKSLARGLEQGTNKIS